MMMRADLIYTNKDEVAIRVKNMLDYKRYYQTNHRFDLRSGSGGWFLAWSVRLRQIGNRLYHARNQPGEIANNRIVCKFPPASLD